MTDEFQELRNLGDLELLSRGNGSQSKQPRFDDASAKDFFSGVLNLVWHGDGGGVIAREPKLSSDSRKRDIWLHNIVKHESYLAGVLSTFIDIDKNRGWRMVGGRNQVLAYTDMCHNMQAAPDLWGWRPSISSLSECFWSTNMGAIVELGRDVKGGPLRAMYTVDSRRCRLTGSNDTPLEYNPADGGQQNWEPSDYFRIVSMPSPDEKFRGLGYCFVDRAVEIAKLMIAVYEHDHEQLGSKAPRGLLLLRGISQPQWNNAMEIRDAQLQANKMDYFDAVAVLANANAEVDAKLIAISNLPLNFNFREFTDMTLYGYALCAGYDPSELWPVQFGALGRGTEGTLQHEKATGKGRLDFPLSFQEQLQMELPATLEFEFEQRDDQGDLAKAQIYKAWADVARVLYEAGHMTVSGSLLNRNQTLSLLADKGIIPANWSPEEDVASTDKEHPDDDNPVGTAEPPNTDIPKAAPAPTKVKTPPKEEPVSTQRVLLKRAREQVLSKPYVWRLVKYYPSDSIVQYVWPENVMMTIYDRADDILKPTVWAVERPVTTILEKTEEEDTKTILVQPNITINMPSLPVQQQTAPAIPALNLGQPGDYSLSTQKLEISVPPQPAPIVNIQIPEQKMPDVIVQMPKQRQPDVIVNVPRQEAPVVNVKAPVVNVNVPKQEQADVNFNPVINVPPAEVTINVPEAQVTVNNEIKMPPAKKEKITVERDRDGNIQSMIKY